MAEEQSPSNKEPREPKAEVAAKKSAATTLHLRFGARR